MQTITHDPDFILPVCQAQRWETECTVPVNSREQLIRILTAQIPIGLPSLDLTLEVRAIRNQIRSITFVPYGDTNGMVQYAGTPFVEFNTLREYLNNTYRDPIFENCQQLLLSRISSWFNGMGFSVEILQDVAGSYHAGVIRKIQVAAKCQDLHERNDCSVLHVDDINRDGKFKEDFRLPPILHGMDYFQSSFNVLLDDGCFKPDSLFVHELIYSHDQEKYFNGWRSDLNLVANSRVVEHRPVVAQPYFI